MDSMLNIQWVAKIEGKPEPDFRGWQGDC